jgi:subtilisin family serine protease
MGFSIGSAQGSAAPSTRSFTRLALALLAGFASWGAQAAQPTEWVKGRVIVQTRAGLSDAELDKIVKIHGGKARRIGKSDLHIVDLPGNASETAVQAQLAHNPHLKFAELDGLVRPSFASNDPYLGSEWHLNTMGAASAWDLGQGAGVTIAILDTGVDITHPDLAGHLVPGWNFYANTADVTDVYNHGTAVAGVAAAATNNGVGVAGLAGRAMIMPIRISDDAGVGSWSAMAQGLTYAADHGVRVANISYIAGGNATVLSAAQYMKNKNGLVFVSAGNTGAESTAPATTALIPVGATDGNDVRASFSTFGPYVSLTAPGTGLYTTVKGGGYSSGTGTSFSSPAAAGAAALVMSVNPSLSSTQVENILFSTAVDLGTAGRDPYYGYGRVNVAAAAQAARSMPAADTTAPTVSIASPGASATLAGLATVDVSASDNVGVTKVELKVNGTTKATDVSAPFGFSLDTTQLANGMATLTAVAYDAAGNSKTSASVSVNIANTVNNLVADTTPPVVALSNPVNGAKVSGVVSIVSNASDNAGTAQLSQVITVDGARVASGTGGSLSYSWNTKKAGAGSHVIAVTATDGAGNRSTSTVTVSK